MLWFFDKVLHLIDRLIHWRMKKDEPAVVVEPPVDPLDSPDHPSNQP